MRLALQGPAFSPRRQRRGRAAQACALACALLIGFASPRLARAEDDYVTHVGEPTVMSASEAWRQSGIRVQLLGGYQRLAAAAHLPASNGVMFGLQPSVRLSPEWSIDVLFCYAVFTASGAGSGIHWTAQAGASLFPVAGLSISAGLGYSGVDLSYWTETTVAQCSGAGGAAQARVSYLIPALEGFATGPIVHGEIDAMRCTDLNTGARTFHWWPSFGVAWGVAWR